MDEPRNSSPRSGGAIIALAVIAGAVGGVILQQPSIGVLAGLALGVVAAIVVWLADRR